MELFDSYLVVSGFYKPRGAEKSWNVLRAGALLVRRATPEEMQSVKNYLLGIVPYVIYIIIKIAI